MPGQGSSSRGGGGLLSWVWRRLVSLRTSVSGGDGGGVGGTEQEVQRISESELFVQRRMERRDRAASRAGRRFAYLALNLEVLIFAFMLLRARKQKKSLWNRDAIVAPIFVIPAITAIFYRAFMLFTRILNARDSRVLEKLSAQKRLKIAELQENFETTKKHIEETEADSTLTSVAPAVEHENISRSTVHAANQIRRDPSWVHSSDSEPVQSPYMYQSLQHSTDTETVSWLFQRPVNKHMPDSKEATDIIGDKDIPEVFSAEINKGYNTKGIFPENYDAKAHQKSPGASANVNMERNFEQNFHLVHVSDTHFEEFRSSIVEPLQSGDMHQSSNKVIIPSLFERLSSTHQAYDKGPFPFEHNNRNSNHSLTIEEYAKTTYEHSENSGSIFTVADECEEVQKQDHDEIFEATHSAGMRHVTSSNTMSWLMGRASHAVGAHEHSKMDSMALEDELLSSKLEEEFDWTGWVYYVGDDRENQSEEEPGWNGWIYYVGETENGDKFYRRAKSTELHHSSSGVSIAGLFGDGAVQPNGMHNSSSSISIAGLFESASSDMPTRRIKSIKMRKSDSNISIARLFDSPSSNNIADLHKSSSTVSIARLFDSPSRSNLADPRLRATKMQHSPSNVSIKGLFDSPSSSSLADLQEPSSLDQYGNGEKEVTIGLKQDQSHGSRARGIYKSAGLARSTSGNTLQWLMHRASSASSTKDLTSLGANASSSEHLGNADTAVAAKPEEDFSSNAQLADDSTSRSLSSKSEAEKSGGMHRSTSSNTVSWLIHRASSANLADLQERSEEDASLGVQAEDTSRQIAAAVRKSNTDSSDQIVHSESPPATPRVQRSTSSNSVSWHLRRSLSMRRTDSQKLVSTDNNAVEGKPSVTIQRTLSRFAPVNGVEDALDSYNATSEDQNMLSENREETSTLHIGQNSEGNYSTDFFSKSSLSNTEGKAVSHMAKDEEGFGSNLGEEDRSGTVPSEPHSNINKPMESTGVQRSMGTNMGAWLYKRSSSMRRSNLSESDGTLSRLVSQIDAMKAGEEQSVSTYTQGSEVSEKTGDSGAADALEYHEGKKMPESMDAKSTMEGIEQFNKINDEVSEDFPEVVTILLP